jgi:hypothetical protein
LVLLILVYTLSSIKLEIRAKQFLPGSKGMGEEGRNDANIVCTYE